MDAAVAPPTALGDFLLGRTGVLDCPLAGLVLELGGVTDQHASHLCVLRIFGLGCAKKGLE